jgi:PKHD-type hydroxylase
MLLHIPGVLNAQELADIRNSLQAASWSDGAATAGAQAAKVKRNRQIAADAPEAKGLGDKVKAALLRNPLFQSAALPRTILTPRFNRYEGGDSYGAHIDSAIHTDGVASGGPWRTDVSTTIFLNEPDEYEGGDLVVEDTYGEHEAKLPAGDALVYAATSRHRVTPVTAGVRLASFLWTQSLVRDDAQRTTLFELDMAILSLRNRIGDAPEVVTLTGHYHNLLRRWADT